MESYTPVSDEQWQALKPLFPTPPKRGRGKPHTPWRAVVNSILFILFTNGKWCAIPTDDAFASKSAAHRWYIAWKRSGLLDEIVSILRTLHPERKIVIPPLRAPYVRMAASQPAAIQLRDN